MDGYDGGSMASKKSTKTVGSTKANSRGEPKSVVVPQESVPPAATGKALPRAGVKDPVASRRSASPVQGERKPSGAKHRRAAVLQPGEKQTEKLVRETPAASHEPALTGAPAMPSFGHQEIAVLAYSYWEDRGHGHGHEAADWARAEETLRLRQARTMSAVAE